MVVQRSLKTLLTLTLGASCLASCGGTAGEPSSSGPTTNTPMNTQPVVEAPKDFAFPIYPNATKVHWEPYDSTLPIPRYHVSFHSDDAKDKVVEFYSKQVKDLGWELQGEIDKVDDLVIITANKDGHHVSIQISNEHEGSGFSCAIITDKQN